MNSTSQPIKLRFLIVNSFTSFNLLVGILSLIAAANGTIALAAWGVLVCVILDSCDGLLARRWQVTSQFGAHFDSLADMTSFIIACVALTFYWVRSDVPPPLLVIACGLYAISGAIRLARFNTTGLHGGYFQGMPTTSVATMLAANYLINPRLDSYWIVGLVTLMALLMVSILPYPKMSIHKCPPWLPLVIIAGAFISLSWTVWIMSAAYISLGPAIWLYRRYTAR